MGGAMVMATYELPLEAPDRSAPSLPRRGGAGALPENLLIRNVLWFCGLRWTVIAFLVVFGCLALVPGAMGQLGLQGHSTWPLVTAGVLTLANVGFLLHARGVEKTASAHGARLNLWGQIVSDLIVLTAVIHFAGSVETFVPFTYLFHIVLACIFFSSSASLLVTALACVLYTACVLAEETGIIPPGGLFTDHGLREQLVQVPGLMALHVGSALAVWLVVWYLASHLSAMVRDRDNELAETNRRLVWVQEERTKHMLRTTHELKAPFAAIHANTQLLLKGHCGPLPEEAVEVIERIDGRSSHLAREIQEMLQLANLRSSGDKPPPFKEVDLCEVARWCMAQLQATAADRCVVVDADLQPAWTCGVEEHLRMLLANVLSNAITYSYPGGHVRLKCCRAGQEAPAVSVEDDGIGIVAEKLPHIFDEHYRTDEAVRHSGVSSGLGLAIVRHVAESHGIRIRVASQPKVGTRFEVVFPPLGCSTAKPDNEEAHNGVRDARG